MSATLPTELITAGILGVNDHEPFNVIPAFDGTNFWIVALVERESQPITPDDDEADPRQYFLCVFKSVEHRGWIGVWDSDDHIAFDDEWIRWDHHRGREVPEESSYDEEGRRDELAILRIWRAFDADFSATLTRVMTEAVL